MRFRSVRSLVGLRGITADVVLFDNYHPSRDLLDSIAPNLAGSPVGEVIRP